ncbi:MAG: 50S ribosomal protein L29 [bacterium]
MKYKYKEIKTMGLEEIKVKEDDIKKEIFNLRIQKSIGSLENPKRLKLLKKQIAWIKTSLNERNRGVK